MTRFRSASDTLRITATGQGAAYGYAPWTRTTHHLDETDWGILQNALRPLTHAEHVAHLQRLSGLDAAVLEERIGRLRDAGLLVNAEAFSEVREGDATGAAVTRVGIPTRNRSEVLARCVKSWSDAAKRSGRELVISVADDGRTDEERDPGVSALRGLTDVVPIRYNAAADRVAYALELAAEADVDPELVTWALNFEPPDERGEGAARNSLLLDAVGTGLAFVDDDTTCRFAPAPELGEGAEVVSHHPFELWFPGTGKAANDMVTYDAEVNPFALIESALGHDMHGWAKTASASFDGAPSVMCRNLREHGGRITSVHMGIAGDVATGSVAHYLTLGGRNRQRLHRSQRVYEHAVKSRQGVVASPRWRVAETAHCMTYFLALDMRLMPIPFMPMGRNCDGLFGVLQQLVMRDDYAAFAPWVIEHLAQPRPSSRQHMIDHAADIYANDLIVRVLTGATLQPTGVDRATNLRAAGRVLTQAAHCDVAEFTELVWMHSARTRTADLARLRQAIAAFAGKPSWWAQDAHAVAENLRHLMTQPALCHPEDLTRIHGAERAMGLLRDRCRRYGELLVAWPQLWDAAERLAHRGVRPTRPLV